MNVFYAFVEEAAATIFVLAAKCRYLTGRDPAFGENVEAQVEQIERM